jgi:hypothetical protein
MISFRDKTFCPFWGDCEDGIDCPRALTKQVQQEAIKWWGSDEAPISMYVTEPKCFKEMEP